MVITNGTKIEILAPAGSYESFRAAISAGADAVYAGGPRFGARAYAANFTQEELLEAIDYAHLHNRRFYLTVNTLLKEPEMEELGSYLKPLYCRGLDAVIVQDVGVLRLVREAFPEIDIHASTQMTITDTKGALFLKEQGVTRVVPARELSLSEVARMAESAGMEIECFVHGALCYSYSGQCLLSSFIGGRSGNRGQCAQPCRLPYTVNGKKEHFLSLKDICTLELIPDMIEAGIDSFKIEGRMKSPQYAALVTAMYRKYTDMYLECGRKGFYVADADKEKLLDIYNRGGFCQGYYTQGRGRDMLALKGSGHTGTPAVRINSQMGRKIAGEALIQIHKGDIIKLDGVKGKMDNYTFGKDITQGGTAELLLPKGISFPKGSVLCRIRNEELLASVSRHYMDRPLQEKITGSFWTAVGEPAYLQAEYGGFQVTARTKEAAESAKSRPLDEAGVRSMLLKTGNTDFYFDKLTVKMEGDVFFPMQRLGELKRTALKLLRCKVCESYAREEPRKSELVPAVFKSGGDSRAEMAAFPYLSVLVETGEQAEAALNSSLVRRIYAESAANWNFTGEEGYADLCKRAGSRGKEIFLAMPHIYRREADSYFQENIRGLEAFDGVLIRNYESFYFLRQHGFDKQVILDHNLYVFNLSARQFWKELLADSFTAPAELACGELKGLVTPSCELIVYGRLPVMVSAQCLVKAAAFCSKTEGITIMKDRRQKEFPVKNCCRFCYNVVYHERPLNLLSEKEEILCLGPGGIRMQFTDESGSQVMDILAQYKDRWTENRQPENRQPDNGQPDNRQPSKGSSTYTNGHFRQGII